MTALPLAHYIHNLQPEIFKITDTFGPKWYGLAYVAGFFCAYLLMVWMAKRKIGPLEQSQVGDFIFGAALFGVMLGGRIGYVLFYRPDILTEDPLGIFKVWDGGMASHGGVIGLMIFTFVYSRMKNISWTALGDNLVVVAPIGILFGRIANFINGELYGHPTTVSWAVKFPAEFINGELGPVATRGIFDVANSMAPQIFTPDRRIDIPAFLDQMHTNDAFRQAVGEFLTPRHPSQLYEGALEGLVLFGILFAVRVIWRNAPNGLLTSLFFICYAIFRIIVEHFRVPDAELIMGLTRGQFYSVPMLLVGLGFLVFSFTQRKAATQGNTN
ncbi:prolipoprotein diacylglyceryl transferase [Sulfuriroseicoccus oceanibius]|uniref:Phosphatidylglycerol--prolipoprotein diacylglyceryl transferase n=1 Tax=Sulfuriroseicoccus oceanibius TaxID=2707525 RepID=A0A6B3LAC3_9BACT|nr:prolipoprotein diacylglyceryl transferase [Sulfuriroseicoccus oceanibius]QQL44001.1 prolipoprotein diacylglyceryl transferase [Sulfuriroseicoccus oceanibius]